MKQQIVKTSPINQIEFFKIDLNSSLGLFIGLQTQIIKYILQKTPNGYTFANGTSEWDSDPIGEDLIKRNLDDGRVTMFLFSDLKELATWILE